MTERRYRHQKFKPVEAKPVTEAHVRTPEPSDWREVKFAEREQVRMAARNEVESVDNRLRAGFSSVAGAGRSTWDLAEGRPPGEKVSGWRQPLRTISGMIRDWRSRRRT